MENQEPFLERVFGEKIRAHIYERLSLLRQMGSRGIHTRIQSYWLCKLTPTRRTSVWMFTIGLHHDIRSLVHPHYPNDLLEPWR